MIKLVDNYWLNLLIGIVPIVFITLENLFTNRRKTMPVMLLDEIFFILVSFILFGWPVLIAGALGVAFIIYLKLRDKYDEEYSYLNYSEGIMSVSGVINSLKLNDVKKENIVVGQIMPVRHGEIPDNKRAIPLTKEVLSGGIMISGASGSGKTRTLMSIISQGVKKKHPIFFFDFKGETDILEELEDLAKANGIKYYEFSSRRITFKYDPFVNLNTTGKIQALMTSRSWASDGSDSYYKNQLQSLLQDIIPEYEKYRRENNIEENYIIGLHNFYSSGEYKVASNYKDGFNTLKGTIDILITSRVRDMLNNDKEEFSFDDDRPCIIAFSFTSANKDLANYICAFIFQDIMDRGTRRRYTNKPILAIDEFGTLSNSFLIKDILEKGRSVGLQTIFSILDLNQLVENVSRAFAESILGIINTFIIFAGATSGTAELLSSVYRYDAEFDIMSLEKPQNGNPPTCLFISKWKVLNKKGAQEVHKMIPYLDKSAKENKKETSTYSPKKEGKNIYRSKVNEPKVEEVVETEEPVTNEEVPTNAPSETDESDVGISIDDFLKNL